MSDREETGETSFPKVLRTLWSAPTTSHNTTNAKMAHVGSQVRAVYDFSGEAGTAELSILAGETLTLTRNDVGEGWWEGVNEAGLTGLFPAAYVEEIRSRPPAMPPPPLPDTFSETWGGTSTSEQPSNSQTQSFEGGDYWEDDDWDDDVEPSTASVSHAFDGGNINMSGKFFPVISTLDDDPSLGVKGEFRGLGGVTSTGGKKNFNRFSGFGKTGLDSFILSTTKLDVAEADKIYIQQTDENAIVWKPITDHYTCIVASPKKESKLKGLKSFIAYQLTPTFNNIQVSRRYKHFDWLHERLGEKFSLIPIPPLPDKQISVYVRRRWNALTGKTDTGRYEEQFIERRRVQLQAFVNSVCRHPVLSQCSVWQHFMTCTDEKRWKSGKRKEEKDKLLGPNYLFALQVPNHPLDLYTVEEDQEKCAKFIHSMDGAVKSLMATAADQVKKHQGPYKREYQKIGQAFLALGVSFDEITAVKARVQLTKAVKFTGETYNEIATMFEEQPKLDWEPLADVLHVYKGILSTFPDIIACHRGSIQKRKDCEKQVHESKMEEFQLVEVKKRVDMISYAFLAEVSHFHSERTEDFRLAMKSYLSEQINFYQKIVTQLQDALEAYDA